MNKSRILLVIQICIVLLLGISLFMQVEISKNKAFRNATTIMEVYNQSEFKVFESSEDFINVNEQIYNIGANVQDLLAKSKKEKIIVTTN